MKTLVIYSSRTGFTKRYAEGIAERTQGELLELKEARKKDDRFFAPYDAIVFGSWAMGGSFVKLKWFLEKAPAWKEKRLAVFGVGASPNASPEIDGVLQKTVPDPLKKNVRAFYCQGGLDYDKMRFPYKQMMRMFSASLAKKKDATEDEKKKAAMIAESYDISDISYTDPIVAWITE